MVEIAIIYKILTADEWRELHERGRFLGAPVDRKDGFVHLSTAAQVAETAAKHFAGQDGLMLVAVRTEPLGSSLRWEPSRGGALFPHLYAPLELACVRWARPLPRRAGGAFELPELES